MKRTQWHRSSGDLDRGARPRHVGGAAWLSMRGVGWRGAVWSSRLGQSGTVMPTRQGPDDILPGFVLSQLHELPKPGDHFVWGGWRFEVVDIDARRIDMILVQRQPNH